MTNPPRDGLVIAWVTFVGGTAASVAANVAHARLYSTEVGPQIAGAFWPLALLAAVEIITRVQWPSGRLWAFARYGGAGAVALGSAILSYRHMRDLLTAWGERGIGAHVGPLVVDALMIVAGTALLAMSKSRQTVDQQVPAVSVPVPAESEAVQADPEPVPVAIEPEPVPAPDRDPRELALEFLSSGERPTGRQLGARYGMSESWGRKRIQEWTESRKLRPVEAA